MAAGKITQGFIPNYLEEFVIGNLGRLTRKDLHGVAPMGSGYPMVYVCSPYGSSTKRAVVLNQSDELWLEFKIVSIDIWSQDAAPTMSRIGKGVGGQNSPLRWISTPCLWWEMSQCTAS